MLSDDSGTLRAQGLTALRSGQLQEAIRLLTEATTANPTDVQALAMLGAAYGQAGSMNEAVEALQKAAALNPGSASIQYNLGVACRKAGRIEEARAALRASLGADPSYQRARDALAAMRETPLAPSAAPLAGPLPGSPPAAAAGAGLAPGFGAGNAAVPGATATDGLTAPAPMAVAQEGGVRIAAGIGWGALTMGLWQGAWALLFGVIFGGMAGAKNAGSTGVATGVMVGVIFAVIIAVVGALVGAVMGLIIALLGASDDAGTWVGGAGNVLFRLAERLLLGGVVGFNILISLVIAASIGAWLGRIIAAKTRGAQEW